MEPKKEHKRNTFTFMNIGAEKIKFYIFIIHIRGPFRKYFSFNI